MKISRTEKTQANTDQKPVSTHPGVVSRDFSPVSGKEILNRILDQDSPGELIRHLPSEDFFWLVKKVGKDDCLPLLELASEDQWQYVLDLELWRKDLPHPEGISEWLDRLQQADSKRLVRWLFGKGQALAYYYLFRSTQIVIREENEAFDYGDEFFTLDGVFYIRILHKEHKEAIENILRTIAREDPDRYKALLLGVAGVLPAESEEDMYRLRNVRLAEHGFLPFEEALSVYAPLDPETLSFDEPTKTIKPVNDEAARELIPVSPLFHAMGQNLLSEAISGNADNLFLDRMRLEFAGLCNQIISADGLLANELEVLIRTCRKAAGYLNLALEELCGTDIPSAERLLQSNALVSVFRMGFGLALKLKWEADRWVKESWFHRQGLDFSFWGDEWGETLAGILKKRPCLFSGLGPGEEYRGFERLSELDVCYGLIHRLIILDKILERLAGLYPLDKGMLQDFHLTFHALLINLWARQLLKLEPGFSSISPDQAKEFLCHLRSGDRKPPYRMAEFKEIFIRHFMAYASDLAPDATAPLEDALSLIWQEFNEELAWIPTDDLDGRFTRFLWIMPKKTLD